MAGSRSQGICLGVVFLAMLAVVAPSQLVFDWRQGDPPQIAEIFRQTPTKANLRRLENNLENGCRVGQAVRPWMQCARFALLEDAGDNAIFGRDGWFFYRPAVRYFIEPWSPEGSQSHGNVLDAIVSFRDELAKRDIQLLMVPAPNKASVYPEMLTERAGEMIGPVNPETQSVLARLSAAGIEVLDLFELYNQAKQMDDAPKYYLAQDSHWSPEGMRLAAEAVTRRLLDLGWVAKGTREYEARPVPVRRYGDVLEMMRVPQIERFLEPQTMNCTQVVDH